MRVAIGQQKVLSFHFSYGKNRHNKSVYPNYYDSNLGFFVGDFVRILKRFDHCNISFVRHRQER